MTDYSKLTNMELDDLMATQVMGWYKGFGGTWKWGEYNGTTYMDFSGPSIASWHPSRGKTLNAAANEVLLKTLEDGYPVHIDRYFNDDYRVEVYTDPLRVHIGIAATIPRALCEAIAAAFAGG